MEQRNPERIELFGGFIGTGTPCISISLFRTFQYVIYQGNHGANFGKNAHLTSNGRFIKFQSFTFAAA
jgi:hypothetical protein